MGNDEKKQHGCKPNEEPAPAGQLWLELGRPKENLLEVRKMVIVIEYDPLKAEKAAAAYRAFKAAMDAMGIKISAKRVYK